MKRLTLFTQVRGYIASENSRNGIQLRQAQIERGSGIFAAMYPRIWVFIVSFLVINVSAFGQFSNVPRNENEIPIVKFWDLNTYLYKVLKTEDCKELKKSFLKSRVNDVIKTTGLKMSFRCHRSILKLRVKEDSIKALSRTGVILNQLAKFNSNEQCEKAKEILQSSQVSSKYSNGKFGYDLVNHTLKFVANCEGASMIYSIEDTISYGH